MSAIYKTFKTGTYFQLKSRTPLWLCSNVVYKFTCSWDSNLTHIGKSTRHLSAKVGELLNVARQHENGGIKQHILSCTVCSNARHDLNSFKVLKQCKSDLQAKSHEALLIKKHRPSLNKHLHAHGSSFLLNIYKWWWRLLINVLFSPRISLFSISKLTVDLLNAIDDLHTFNARWLETLISLDFLCFIFSS